MEILLKGVRIVDPESPHHGKKSNVFIKNGKIESIGRNEPSKARLIDASGMILSPGWCDLWANFCDPGAEHKEDLQSGMETAASGGFTDVAVLPNTSPPIETKNDISYILSASRNHLVNLHPISAVTKGIKGEEITEMIDLHHSGAIAFSDGLSPISHPDIMLKTLQYLQKFDGLVINRPEDERLDLFGSMHEGRVSTELGLKGMPRLSEELAIKRDLSVLEYTGGRIHFANISSANSVDLIRKAKKDGLGVTCDVVAHQFVLTDEELLDFDSNFKLNPPLREDSDTKAILRGLNDGTIDAIVSGHNPQDEESKKLEFELAEFGAAGMQTVFHCLNAVSEKVDMGTLINKVAIRPREILGLPGAVIKPGSDANLTLMDPGVDWELNDQTNTSKSENSPFWGRKLKGKIMATFNNRQMYLAPELK